jgi:FtsP/CotA-like multicopper oxidase with cupredoxin domain
VPIPAAGAGQGDKMTLFKNMLLPQAGPLSNNSTSNSQSGQNKSNQSAAGSQNSSMSSMNMMRFDPPEVPFVTETDLTFQRNQTYRIRLLNSQFDSVFSQFRFLTECNETSNDPASCKKQLNFSVIGSDSSLFDKPIHVVSNITIASAERFEMLIIFDGDDGQGNIENPISEGASYVYLISG